MIGTLPKHFFMVTGASEGYTPLNAFDGALLDAGIGNTNLIKMSSIIPPGATLIEPVLIPAGSFLPVAYGSLHSDVPGEVIAAAVSAAVPDDPSLAGVIMEYSARGRKEDVESIARAMAEEAMARRGVTQMSVHSASKEIKVQSLAAIFAAVVLWNDVPLS
ncbi:pyruvoyl-dependent arginine decarboxylase [bacterium SM23_57]|nr:MAG: pyruvoyl-dependent arginine decarboxylase [bacterium SM23_57]